MPTPFPFVAGQVLTAAQLNSITELPTRTLTGSGAAVAADAYSRVILNGSSITYTINTSTFTAGQVVEIYNANSTAATIAAGAGVTLNGAAGLTLAQYQTAELYAISATSFVLWKSDVTVSSVTYNQNEILTTQSTTSTSYTDLATVGPQLTVTTGTTALIVVQATMYGLVANTAGYMSHAVSGATTVSASNDWAAFYQGTTGATSDFVVTQTSVYYRTGLTAGSNTFTAKYKVTGGTGQFLNRRMVILS